MRTVRPAGDREELTDTGFSRAYSAPESEQYAIAPYLPADVGPMTTTVTSATTPQLVPGRYARRGRRRTASAQMAVGGRTITAILAAIALVVSVSLLVTSTDTEPPHPTTTTVNPRRSRTRSPRPHRPRRLRRLAARRRRSPHRRRTETVTVTPPSRLRLAAGSRVS